MDLLNIYYTEESSVLTEGEMSFTLYAIRNMGDTHIMYCYFDIVTLCLACQTLEPESIPGWALTTNCFVCFSFSFFPLVMQNYFIQEI